jgi:hypothetical protein
VIASKELLNNDAPPADYDVTAEGVVDGVSIANTEVDAGVLFAGRSAEAVTICGLIAH